MAELTGLEPATSAVTGQRSNQLSYNSKKAREVYFYFGPMQMFLELFSYVLREKRYEERNPDTRATTESASATERKAVERSA